MGDELRVPSQRADAADDDNTRDPHSPANDHDVRADDDLRVIEPNDHDVRANDNDPRAGDPNDDPRTGDPHDEHARVNDAGEERFEDTPYRDPYGRADDTTADTDLDPDHQQTRVHPGPVVDQRPAYDEHGEHDEPVADQAHDEPVVGGTPTHAAPQEVVLFDQDPAEVQGRWRDVQASFVDDPRDAVQRADGLVGEVVDSLTTALTSHTGELRGRWQSADKEDTEQLRLALRDYRNVLERLLSFSGPGQR
ncbi:hypothetical protein [Nonomuraea cavernae]|uniref:Uncharacterized protein n=1 Tax=Nonomuraea cavernae TaxID=2045107 RepID=A0A917ZF69_9ACTN|nr:hypothetical protein [Nonomuraea cavernae]MCA2190394.1 hypothetical protein [Nonomuraea cavernae]GGO80854.1 hypothetical protein GCM10012289_68470 [Nonomuraea cavernae]